MQQSAKNKMERKTRFELATLALARRCSTPEPLPHLSNRQRPTFPGSFPPSIIGAKELNYCVRDGNRCDLPAIVTGYIEDILYLQN